MSTIAIGRPLPLEIIQMIMHHLEGQYNELAATALGSEVDSE